MTLRVPDFASEYRAGASLSQIAGRHGRSAEFVRKKLRAAGVPRRGSAEGTRLAGKARRRTVASTSLDDDMAWLAGAVAGDGWLTDDGVHLSAGLDREFAELFVEVALAKLGIPGRVVQNNRDYWEAHLWSREARAVFHALGKRHSWDWFIADEILEAPDSILASFLQGLFDADGGVLKNHGRRAVCLTTVSMKAARQLEAAFVRLGLEFGETIVYPRPPAPPPENHHRKYMFRLVHVARLEVFEQRIGFRVPRKVQELREVIESCTIRRLPKAEVDGLQEEILRLRSQGLTIKGTARELGLTRQSVLDVDRRGRTSTFGDALRNAREARGWTQTDLVRRLGEEKPVPAARISVWESGAGQLPRPETMDRLVKLMPELEPARQTPDSAQYANDELIDDMVRLLTQGMAPTAIAEELGVSETVVHRRLRGEENRALIGDPLKKAREGAGWSQQELADRIGRSIASVSNWECGASLPRGDALEALRVALPSLEPAIRRLREAS